jgi:hypothetical protein
MENNDETSSVTSESSVTTAAPAAAAAAASNGREEYNRLFTAEVGALSKKLHALLSMREAGRFACTDDLNEDETKEFLNVQYQNITIPVDKAGVVAQVLDLIKGNEAMVIPVINAIKRRTAEQNGGNTWDRRQDTRQDTRQPHYNDRGSDQKWYGASVRNQREDSQQPPNQQQQQGPGQYQPRPPRNNWQQQQGQQQQGEWRPRNNNWQQQQGQQQYRFTPPPPQFPSPDMQQPPPQQQQQFRGPPRNNNNKSNRMRNPTPQQ